MAHAGRAGGMDWWVVVLPCTETFRGDGNWHARSWMRMELCFCARKRLRELHVGVGGLLPLSSMPP
jgi:hypothetical protein